MEAVGERGNSVTGRLVHPEQGRVPSHFRAIHKEDLDPSWKAPGVHDDFLDDETDKTKSSVNGERAAAVGLKRYCENFLSSKTGGGDSDHNGNSMITELVYEMKVMEVEARRCYSEKFNDISASEFVTFLTVASSFSSCTFMRGVKWKM
ncbi:uncharacterized protein LOC113302240 isoform X4 [Papaver somniferum]|uniref:uncharacterized protein LOC113302240 isoform X4 n=1 Tax=Papaver somniferum TaxID=3469 RepID=UPI000E701209|nr:uncharacterized protein LOC113302240 isoform X4 [Papaver somniferum]